MPWVACTSSSPPSRDDLPHWVIPVIAVAGLVGKLVPQNKPDNTPPRSHGLSQGFAPMRYFPPISKAWDYPGHGSFRRRPDDRSPRQTLRRHLPLPRRGVSQTCDLCPVHPIPGPVASMPKASAMVPSPAPPSSWTTPHDPRCRHPHIPRQRVTRAVPFVDCKAARDSCRALRRGLRRVRHPLRPRSRPG